MLYPMLWTISNSFKSGANILGKPSSLTPEFYDLRNYVSVFQTAPFDLYIINSIITALVIVFSQVLLSSLMAFGFTYFKFKGRNILYGAVIGTLMIPAAITYVPSYILISRMNLLNTLFGVIISNVVNVATIFYLVQIFKGVPKEMLEAAEIEGANKWQVYYKVVLPYTRSSIFTAGLISFIQNYNNYLWPSLITNSQSNMLVSQGLNALYTIDGNFTGNIPIIMAANVVVIIPLIVIYIIFQKRFVVGVSNSGVKN